VLAGRFDVNRSNRLNQVAMLEKLLLPPKLSQQAKMATINSTATQVGPG
jgi:hypothetical protein